MKGKASSEGKDPAKGKATTLVIILPAILLALAGCSTESPVEIHGVIFGRDLVAVSLRQAASIESIGLYEDEKELARRAIGADGENFVLELSWEPGRLYTVQVTPAGGATPVSVRYKSPEKPSPVILGQVDLEGDVEPRGIRDSAYLGGRVAMSPDGFWAAVGTEKSHLRVFGTADRRELWSKRIGEGRILAVAFAARGSRLLVGEQSRDAFVYCFDVRTGRELWRYRTANDVGEMERGDPRARWPVIAGVAVVEAEDGGPGARCFVASKRTYETPSGLAAVSRVHAFDVETGAMLWAFPQEGAMDASPSMLATDGRGGTVLFNNWKKGKHFHKALYGLSGETGRELWGWEMEQLTPGRDYLIWHGFGISRDGSRVVVLSQDGRGFLLDHEVLVKTAGRSGILWEREISAPVMVHGMRLIGQGAKALIKDHYVVFATGSTIVQQAGSNRTFIEHPSGNSVFIHDLEGRLLWTSKPGGLCYDIPLSEDGRYVILGAAHGKAEKDTSGHGVYVFDNARSGGGSDRLAWFLNTEGICLSVAASADGKHIVALEYPIDMDPRSDFEDVRGRHRLYFLR